MSLKRPIFRQTALENLLTPEQLDQLLQITTPKGWLALLAIMVLIGAAMGWGFWGSIPNTVTGHGFLIRKGGVSNIVSQVDGQVVEVYFQAGELVEEGQVVARVLEEGHQTATRVLSPYQGEVIEVKASEGDLVKRGTSILSLELVGKDVQDLIAVIYVSSFDGKKIERGMDVQIVPTMVQREESGFIWGKVTTRSEFPTSRQGMLRSLGSEELVQAILAESGSRPPIEVIADLVPGDDGPRWSSSKGASVKLASGTPCTADIILGQKRPIDLLIK